MQLNGAMWVAPLIRSSTYGTDSPVWWKRELGPRTVPVGRSAHPSGGCRRSASKRSSTRRKAWRSPLTGWRSAPPGETHATSRKRHALRIRLDRPPPSRSRAHAAVRLNADSRSRQTCRRRLAFAVARRPWRIDKRAHESPGGSRTQRMSDAVGPSAGC